jgi:hypothetical protein
MIEQRYTAVTVEQQPARVHAIGIAQPQSVAISQSAPYAATQAATQVVVRTALRVGGWAADTAQQFAMLVAVLMGPAVFSAYAFAVWALAGDLGWTDSFVFPAGALSNWIIWLGVAVLVNTAAAILKKRTTR